MFSRTDGPTALRPDLVRALSFSIQELTLETEEGPRRALCGLAGVWNDSKGVVVLIVRHLSPPTTIRYAFAEPVNSEAELEQAIDSGIGYAESLGFLMDAPDFLELPEQSQQERLRVWNELRKVRRSGSRPEPDHAAALRAMAAEGSEPSLPAPVSAPSPGAPSGPAAPARTQPDLSWVPSLDVSSLDDRAVLGRIPLVQREGAEPRSMSVEARLRAFF
jgi:hypothetical protein